MATAMLAYWSSRVAGEDSEARLIAAIDVARKRTIGPEGPSSQATAADQELAARLLGEAGRLWAMNGRPDIGLGWAEDAVRLAQASGSAQARLAAMGGLGVSYAFTGRGRELRDVFADASDLGEATGSWWIVAMSSSFSGSTIADVDPDAAETLLRRGEEAARRAANPYVLGAAAMARGRALSAQRRLDESAAAFERSIARFSEIGDLRLALAARSDYGHALRRGGRFDEALSIYRETIEGWVNFGNRGAVANQLENVAYIAIEQGGLARAAQLLGAAETIRETAGSSMAFDEVPEYRSFVERLRAGLQAPELGPAWTAGRAMSMAEAVRLARDDERVVGDSEP
jgi:tetratricopeptide (TPR) repeat protein